MSVKSFLSNIASKFDPKLYGWVIVGILVAAVFYFVVGEKFNCYPSIVVGFLVMILMPKDGKTWSRAPVFFAVAAGGIVFQLVSLL